MFRLNLIGLFCLLFSGGLLAERLDLSAGAMTAGGSALIKYTSSDISKWSSDNWNLGVSTSWGYFVVNNLALVFDLQAAGNFSSGSGSNRLYQFGTGALYALDLDSNLYPYGQILGHATYVESGWSAGFTPSIGLLVGLNSQVALDFGLNTKFDFAISRDGATKLDIGTGYLGVRAFF